jgi:hypothetical protein
MHEYILTMPLLVELAMLNLNAATIDTVYSEWLCTCALLTRGELKFFTDHSK